MDSFEIQELLKATVIGSLILTGYFIVYFVSNKIINRRLIKAIVIGTVTPFFFYYSIAYLIHPFAVLLYILEIDPIGLIAGIISGLLKPLSLLSGILAALYINKNR
ncbi:MAG: hypothetical protein Tsb0014_14870 [Pleurocapsa sp.]